MCDLQERFRLVVHSYPSVLATAEKMIKAAMIMEIPVIATQQAPRGAHISVLLSVPTLFHADRV
ncbi:MAG: hypothetical protein LBE44_01580 [Microbacterium hominis]|nr:hypothetical protein [Microbacterium hominis]